MVLAFATASSPKLGSDPELGSDPKTGGAPKVVTLTKANAEAPAFHFFNNDMDTPKNESFLSSCERDVGLNRRY